jgi:nickel/cobalt transporter (NicO) family protein
VRTTGRFLAVLGVAVAAMAAGAGTASAHPLGNFTINVAIAVTVVPGEARVRYVVDMAEIPTFQETRHIDADGDGYPSGSELFVWAEATGARVASLLEIEAGHRSVALTSVAAAAELRPGQGGLRTLRLEARLTGRIPRHGTISVRDDTYPDRVGWREVSAAGAEGLAVTGSSVPTVSPSGMLTSYPEGLLNTPLRVRAATFSYGQGVQRPSAGSREQAGAGPGTGGALTELVARTDLSAAVILVSLLAAAGIGALHALAPGHGKAITAAYMIGSGGRIRHAVGAGLAVAAMHTSTVLALGLGVVLAESAFPVEQVYPVLTAVAGATAVALGIGSLIGRVRHRHDHNPHGDHSPFSRRGLTALAVSGGLLPSPTAVLVMVAAVALDRAAFGVALVGAFGLGLAAALATVAVMAIQLNRTIVRRMPARIVSALPVVGGTAIVIAGCLVAGGGLAAL